MAHGLVGAHIDPCALESYFDQITARYEAQLREELKSMIDAEVKDSDLLYSTLGEIEGAAGGKLGDIDTVRSLLGGKQTALDGRLNALKQAAQQQLEQEAAAKVEEVKEETVDKVRESVPKKIELPKIGF